SRSTTWSAPAAGSRPPAGTSRSGSTSTPSARPSSRAEPSRSTRHEVEDPQLAARAAFVAAIARPVPLEDAPHVLAVDVGHEFGPHGATLATEVDLGIRMREQVPGPGRVLGAREVRPRDVDRAVVERAAHEEGLARLAAA